MKIIGTAISMTRGDSESISISCQDELGVKIDLVTGDKIYLTIKKSINTTEKILQKIVTEFQNGIAFISILPVDTSLLKYGEYVYDIQLTRGDNTVTTIIEPSTFTLNGEVTYER